MLQPCIKAKKSYLMILVTAHTCISKFMLHCMLIRNVSVSTTCTYMKTTAIKIIGKLYKYYKYQGSPYRFFKGAKDLCEDTWLCG